MISKKAYSKRLAERLRRARFSEAKIVTGSGTAPSDTTTEEDNNDR